MFSIIVWSLLFGSGRNRFVAHHCRCAASAASARAFTPVKKSADCPLNSPMAAGQLAVRDPAELVVLLPQVGLEELGRRQELEDGHVSFSEPAGGGGRRSSEQAAGADRAGSHRGALD
jgi:hypothetical protein